MKISRIVASSAVFSVLVASVLVGASAAHAADFWVDGENLPSVADGDPYLDEWFVGGSSTGTRTTTPEGLFIDGRVQILNGDTARTGLQALADSAEIDVEPTGKAFFQVPVFTGPNGTAFTTLRPAAFNSVNSGPTDLWITSSAFGGFAPGADAPLQEFIAAMDPEYTVLAFGAFVAEADEALIRSITWDGNTYFFGIPPPSGTVSPQSLTVSELADTGVTLTMSGFAFAGGNVYCNVFDEALVRLLPEDEEVPVLEDGTATFAFTRTAVVGTYEISCQQGELGDRVVDSFTVTANAPTPPPTIPPTIPPTLPATGPGDVTPFVLGGALLLLLGAGATVVASRRKRV